MKEKKKCSNQKHKESDAINYCFDCNLYLCNKCSYMHSEYLEIHKRCNLDKDLEGIFTFKCKEQNHKDELEFYCKYHNILVCAACISKIKGKGKGQHNNCDVCLIEEIEEEKKNNLKENITYLEEFSDKVQNSINESKKVFEKINNKKQELKLKIFTIFTKIRNTLNEREEQLLLK